MPGFRVKELFDYSYDVLGRRNDGNGFRRKEVVSEIVLGEIDNVRALAGWPSTDEVPDPEITQALDVATRRVVTLTSIEEADWNSPPASINVSLANDTAEICAASRIVLRVSGYEKVVERSRELSAQCQTNMMLLQQAVASTSEDNPSFIDVNAGYTTYPLNPNVDPYDPTLSEISDRGNEFIG